MSASGVDCANGPEVIRPDWPAPVGVFACTTTRSAESDGGPQRATASAGAEAALKWGQETLLAALDLPARPVFLRQQHGVRVVEAGPSAMGLEADACFSGAPGVVCGVLTADCVPALFCSADGRRVAAAHAGWRGLAGGVLQATVEALGVPGGELLVWLGPAIGPDAFEVGEDVRERFRAVDPDTLDAFTRTGERKWHADLYQLCRQRLASVEVDAVFGGGFCTFTDTRFYSYRRDAATGRMASLIWRE